MFGFSGFVPGDGHGGGGGNWKSELVAPLIGAVVVASLWHLFSDATSARGKAAARRQGVFFDSLFSLLGYIVAAKGMPPEMMRAATERAQEISGTYERIKEARGI